MEILFDLFKLGFVFFCLVAGTKRIGMAASLGIGVLGFGLMSLLPFSSYVSATHDVFTGEAFWYLEIMMLCLLTFTEIFVSSGQCDRMVHALEAYITSPRGRLIVFPVLLALLPAPGGAILSCPMVESASKSMGGLNNERLAVINYWFRHCLETVWPFYPGYLLVCVMASVNMSTLWLYMIPLPILFFVGGRLFLLRGITMHDEGEDVGPRSLREVVFGGLPLVMTIAGAIVCIVVGSVSGVSFIKDWAFVFAPLLGTVVCLRLTGQGPGFLWKAVSSPRVRQILTLMVAIFYFKEFLEQSNFIEPFVAITQKYDLLALIFMIIPFLSGLAVGLYAGFVALCFPVLMPMLQATPELWDNRIAYVVLAIIFGQMGQQLSPTHACFMFSCGYFKANLAKTWQRLLPPIALIGVFGFGWYLILEKMG